MEFFFVWGALPGSAGSHHAEGFVNPKVRALKKGYSFQIP
jgi:hypothetical protein